MIFAAGAQSSSNPSVVLAPESALSLLPSRGLSSAPVASSVSATAVLDNSETKKQLDCRGAFRHGHYRKLCHVNFTSWGLRTSRRQCESRSDSSREWAVTHDPFPTSRPSATESLLYRLLDANGGVKRFEGTPWSHNVAGSAEAPVHPFPPKDAPWFRGGWSS